MLKLTAVTALVLGLGIDPRASRGALVGTESTFGGLSAISIAQDLSARGLTRLVAQGADPADAMVHLGAGLHGGEGEDLSRGSPRS